MRMLSICVVTASREAQAAVFRLIDPAGLGRFRVLGLAKGMSDAPTALGWRGMDVAGELRTLGFG